MRRMGIRTSGRLTSWIAIDPKAGIRSLSRYRRDCAAPPFLAFSSRGALKSYHSLATPSKVLGRLRWRQASRLGVAVVGPRLFQPMIVLDHAVGVLLFGGFRGKNPSKCVAAARATKSESATPSIDFWPRTKTALRSYQGCSCWLWVLPAWRQHQ